MTQQVTFDVITDASVTAAKLATGAAVSNIGASGITSNELAASAVTPAKIAQPLTQGTAAATTSGTAIDFTSIPSWVKRITVVFNGVSVSGTANILIRLGTSGGVEATGYLAQVNAFNNTPSGAADTTGAIFTWANTAASVWNGVMHIVNVSGNSWIASGTAMTSVVGSTSIFAASKTVGATLDRIRLTTTNGTDTFDAGSINILYE